MELCGAVLKSKTNSLKSLIPRQLLPSDIGGRCHPSGTAERSGASLVSAANFTKLSYNVFIPLPSERQRGASLPLLQRLCRLRTEH